MQKIDQKPIPRHIAIIMDGNGRWAKQRGLMRTQGHLEGVKRVEEIVSEAASLGVQVLTLYTFSTENWSRPDKEVSMLMNTLISVLANKFDKFVKNNIRFQIIGRRKGLPEAVLKTLDEVREKTLHNTGMILNLAFNYGSRTEIVDAFRELGSRIRDGALNPDQITEETISRELYTRELPDPDFLIRTSGEQRISNFLLWQLSYAELYFTDVYWPDFNAQELSKAIANYQNRERRYGNVVSQRKDL